MRILVTNDDGIDSPGLQTLARTMQQLGEVVVVAPDEEYSGYGAAIGPIWFTKPEVRRHKLAGIAEAWAISAPPALCALYGHHKVFGHVDLVVAGINPGTNMGRRLYHSGTVGACITARNGGISSIAVSQASSDWDVIDQGWTTDDSEDEEFLLGQHWQGAADVAAVVAEQLLANPLTDPIAININTPNCAASKMRGWKRTEICSATPRQRGRASLVPTQGREGAYTVDLAWSEPVSGLIDEDVGALQAGFVSLTWLKRLESEVPTSLSAKLTEAALDNFFPHPHPTHI